MTQVPVGRSTLKWVRLRKICHKNDINEHPETLATFKYATSIGYLAHREGNRQIMFLSSVSLSSGRAGVRNYPWRGVGQISVPCHGQKILTWSIVIHVRSM